MEWASSRFDSTAGSWCTRDLIVRHDRGHASGNALLHGDDRIGSTRHRRHVRPFSRSRRAGSDDRRVAAFRCFAADRRQSHERCPVRGRSKGPPSVANDGVAPGYKGGCRWPDSPPWGSIFWDTQRSTARTCCPISRPGLPEATEFTPAAPRPKNGIRYRRSGSREFPTFG